MEQVLRDTTHKDALLNLLLVKRGDFVIGRYLGHSDLKVSELLIHADRRKTVSKTSTSGMRRADLSCSGNW